MTKKVKKKKPTGKKDVGGRPRKQIDWDIVKNLCVEHHTMGEIAAILDLNINTIKDNCLRDHGITFPQFYRKYLDVGKSSIRKMLWEQAKKGNSKILLHQARHVLGQWDKQEVEVKVKPFILESPDGGEAMRLGVQSVEEIEGEVIDVEAIEQSEAARYDAEQDTTEGIEDESAESKQDGPV